MTRLRNVRPILRKQMSADTWCSTVELAQACGVSPASALYHLNWLVANGEAEQDSRVVHHLDSAASSRQFIFRLLPPKEPPPSVPPTPAAYRNLRLTENLTGYESTLHGFAALCMLVRK